MRTRVAAALVLAAALGAAFPVLAQPARNLQESLGLSDDQFARLLPLVKRLQRDRRASGQRRMKAMLELRRVLEQGGAREAQVADLLREVKAAEVEGPALVRRDMDAIDAVLDTVQQAKYRLLEVEIERKLRALMSEMRAQNRGRRGMDLPEE
jgi:hypothetical protein